MALTGALPDRRTAGGGLLVTATPAAGAAALLLLGVAVTAAWPAASPLSPDHEGGDRGWSWLYLGAIAAAFCLYLVGLIGLARGARSLRVTLVLAVAIQLLPLAGPVLLSTDAYTYWAYGRVAAVHGANPYEVPPGDFPADPSYPVMGQDWRDTTSVYGPAFTLLSEAPGAATDSPEAAAWSFRVIAAIAMLALVALATILAERKALAAAFVGWNPLLAVHFAGGGHNDALMMALVLGGLALGTQRRQTAGALWATAIALKWVAGLFLVLHWATERGRRRPFGYAGFAAAALLLAALATWRYGWSWFEAVVPLARNLEEQAVYSIPSRVASLLGVSEHAVAIVFGAAFALAFVGLLRQAWHGRARLGLAAGLLLVATPWLVPWYAVWAVAPAAVEEDTPARLLALALSAYLLRDAVPL